MLMRPQLDCGHEKAGVSLKSARRTISDEFWARSRTSGNVVSVLQVLSKPESAATWTTKLVRLLQFSSVVAVKALTKLLELTDVAMQVD